MPRAPASPASSTPSGDPKNVGSARPFLTAVGVRELIALGRASAVSGEAGHILDLVPAGIFACAADGSITFFNRRAAELWGREPELHAPAENFCAGQKILAPDGSPLPAEATPFAVAAREGRSCRGVSYVIERPDGSRYDACLDVDALRDGDGNVCGAITVWQDVTERARAEERVRTEQRELQFISTNAPTILSHWDCEQRLLFASRAFAERWHQRPEDLLGKRMAEVLGEAAFARLQPYIQRVLAGEHVSFELEVPYQQIGPRYIQASYAPDRDEQGRVRGFLAAVLDMTDRRRAEVALLESEARLRLAMRTGKVGLWDWDIVRDELTWTESLYEIHGIQPGEFAPTAESYLALVHPDDRAPVRRAIQSALEIDARFELELRAVRPGGAIVWLFCNATVIREAGRPVRMLGATLDITARKSAELAQRESEARFRTLASHAPVGIFLTNAAGDTIFVNEAWAKMAGIPEAEAYGRDWSRVIHPDDRAKVIADWEAAVRADAAISAEYRFQRPDGAIIWVQGNAVPLRDAAGRSQGYIGTIADVTQRKALAAELEQRVAERTASLSEAIAQMEEFSYSVSHDLRGPLRAMQAYAQALMEDYGERLDDTAKSFIERIRRNSERMENLTHDVLTYSQVARAEFVLRDVNVEMLLKDLVTQYPVLQPGAADLRIIEPLHRVRGHEPSLGQCLANLLTNAAKFVEPGVRPCITVRTERVGGRVRLWVEDNGIGIAPENQANLFRVFERLPTPHAYEGTGIGLAIVRKAMEKMGGSWGVESDGRHGSRFWIELAAA